MATPVFEGPGWLVLPLFCSACTHEIVGEALTESGGRGITETGGAAAASAGTSSCGTVWICDDADGDGVGSATNGKEIQSCGVPLGWCTDCDDTDPTVNPFMPEQWYDDIDSNCDGSVDPTGCEGGDATADPNCECKEIPLEATPPATSCAGKPDLFVYRIRYCEETRCHSTRGVMLIVGNRGDVAFSGQVTLVDELGLEEQPLTLSMAPGEAREVVSLLNRAFSVSLEAPEDCDGGTAPETVNWSSGDCWLP